MIVLFTFIVVLSVVTGCDYKDEGIEFNVAVSSSGFGTPINHDLEPTIVKSVEQLDQIRNSRYQVWWNSEMEEVNHFYLKELTEIYNDDFFKNNSLIIILFSTANSGGQLYVDRIIREEKQLKIYYDFLDGPLTAICSFVLIIEVKAEDVKDIVEFSFHLIEVLPVFCPELIIAVLTKEASLKAFNNNHMFDTSDFPEFEFSQVDNLFYQNANFTRILFLYFANPTYDLARHAVEILSLREDLQSVELNNFLVSRIDILAQF